MTGRANGYLFVNSDAPKPRGRGKRGAARCWNVHGRDEYMNELIIHECTPVISGFVPLQGPAATSYHNSINTIRAPRSNFRTYMFGGGVDLPDVSND